jgi:beta-galactosidase
MRDFRLTMNFNTDWRFSPQDFEGATQLDFDDSEFERVCLPHTNQATRHHYFTEENYRFISWYRRPFTLDHSFDGRKLVVEFDGVMTVATVYINGQQVCEHKGGYTGFSCDITDKVRLGEENILAVRVDSRERKDVPPEGGNVDYMQFGGIYRSVRLMITDPLHIEDVFVIPETVSPQQAHIKAQLNVTNADESNRKFTIRTRVVDADGNTIAEKDSSKEINAHSTEMLELNYEIDQPHLWHIDSPYLYTLQVQMVDGEAPVDGVEERFGVRKVEFRKDGRFYLNGEAIKLRGLNRHQMFPYLGAAMPKRVQRKDADILKYDLGLNFMRCSHYPPDPSFIARCDEIGLLVFEEFPGWVFVGGDEWKAVAKQNLREMILRDRNHPSVMLWGVRINESFDHHNFYVETNRIARELDPTRPTGGVRYFTNTEFLEDVFTVNDFEANLEGKLHTPTHVPSIVTECMGHMYPTKSYDPEARLIHHAQLHAQIQSCSHGIPNLAGTCGWCAFDYYTTSVFGAGDHICYHGVCDIFRNPKFAAHFYRSQMEPKDGIELFIARYMTPEFNDVGDALTVFSNCDRVDLYIDGEKFDTQTPDAAGYPNLPHPPFTFTGIQASYKDKRPNKHEATYEWNGMAWAVGRWLGQMVSKIEAVGIIDDKEVSRAMIAMHGQAARVVLAPDDAELIADGTDCTRIVVKVLDDKGQVLPLCHCPVSFEIAGPGKLFGDNPLSVERGMGAIYAGAARDSGTITLQVVSEGLQGDSAQIHVRETTETFVPVLKD